MPEAAHYSAFEGVGPNYTVTDGQISVRILESCKQGAEALSVELIVGITERNKSMKVIQAIR
jgi:hypothetical protein